MARTASTMMELETLAPAFVLPDVSTGQLVTLASFAGQPALLVMFICRHCPFVKHIQGELARLGKDYADSGLAIVAISANDAVKYPADFESLKEMVDELGFSFPVLYDESQQTAMAYQAACTPDFSCLMPLGGWSTAGSSTTAAPATTCR